MKDCSKFRPKNYNFTFLCRLRIYRGNLIPILLGIASYLITMGIGFLLTGGK